MGFSQRFEKQKKKRETKRNAAHRIRIRHPRWDNGIDI